VRAESDIEIVVNVIDDGVKLDGRIQDALARAIGEAVSNAIEHAEPSRIVVFAEALDAKQIQATVRDDGIDRHSAQRRTSDSAIAAVSSSRDLIVSFVYTERRWYSIVFGLRNSAAAASRVVRPDASKSAICRSWGVS